MLKAVLQSRVPFRRTQVKNKVMFGVISQDSKILRQDTKSTRNKFVGGGSLDVIHSITNAFLLSFTTSVLPQHFVINR